MGESADRIERYIAQQRLDCRDNVAELKQRVSRSVDWRAQCEVRPWTMVAFAVGGGILLSTLLGGPPESRPHEPLEGSTGGDGDSHWGPLKGALNGLAATKLIGFAEELLPGFRNAYSEAGAGRNGHSG